MSVPFLAASGEWAIVVRNKRLGFVKDKKAGAPESLLFGENP